MSSSPWRAGLDYFGLAGAKFNEAGYEFPISPFKGEYRNHRIEIAYRLIKDDDGDIPTISFDVDFENPFDVEIKSFGRGFNYTYTPDYVKIGDPAFDHDFNLFGNKKEYLREIFDLEMRNKLLSLKQEGLLAGIKTDVLGVWRLNTKCWGRSQVLRLMRNPNGFRLVLDTLVDLAEKIEKIPSRATARMQRVESERQEFERKRSEALASGLDVFSLIDSAVLFVLEKAFILDESILEVPGIRSSREIEDELIALGFTLKGVEGFQAIQRLVQEGKVSKTAGTGKVAQYSLVR